MRADSNTTTLLLIEDHRDIAEMIAEYFEQRGFAIDHAADGVTGLHLAVSNTYDVIVADVMLPGIDGIALCRKLRDEARRDTPLLMLTARDTLDDKVAGLDAGADDFLGKPFSTNELMARIRAVLRRKAPEALEEVVSVGGLRIDPSTRRVCREVAGQDVDVKMGPTEFRLLHFLMTHPERVHSRAQLLDKVWGDHVFIEERTVDVHIKRLREALMPAACAGMIETVRGAGYRLTQQTSALQA